MILTHTIALPELLWTVWCCSGLIFLFRLLWMSFTDWRWVITRGINGLREHSAITSVFIFSAMTLTQLIFVLAGVIAMMLPPPVENKVSPLTYVLTGLFMFASVCKSIFGAIIYTRKQSLIERIESGQWSLDYSKYNKYNKE